MLSIHSPSRAGRGSAGPAGGFRRVAPPAVPRHAAGGADPGRQDRLRAVAAVSLAERRLAQAQARLHSLPNRSPIRAVHAARAQGIPEILVLKQGFNRWKGGKGIATMSPLSVRMRMMPARMARMARILGAGRAGRRTMPTMLLLMMMV